MKKNTSCQLNSRTKVVKQSMLMFLFLSLFSIQGFAQVFWTENFNNGCTDNCPGAGYTGVNGAWSVNNTGFNGVESNVWYVSCAENGHTAGICGTGCVAASPTATLATLHLGSDASIFGDIGAAFLNGGFGFFDPVTDKRAESPTINCTGKISITLAFNYIENGDGTLDNATLWYFDGTVWALLLDLAKTPTTCAPQGTWTAFSIALPASANNNANVKIGFRWVNNDDSVGDDPSFAVDDVTLATTSSTTITTGTIAGSPFCACSSVSVPFTSTGTFTAGNIYTAQLSDALGSFATPTAIGTLASTLNSGTIAATIPCATPSGTAYRIRVVSSAPVTTGTDNGVNIIINAPINVTVNDPTICAGQAASLTANGGTTYTWSAGATSTGVNTATASPVTTTTFTVTGTTGGCTDTAHATVTVTPLPNVTVTDPTICSGQTATMTASGATSYTWSAGATPSGATTATASPAITTTYTVTGTTGSCSDTAHSTVTVVTALNVTVNDPTICTGGTATLVASGATSYTWSAGATSTGVNTADASPLVTTTYTVTGTSGTCTDTAHATVTVVPTLNVTVNDPTICSGQTASLTANGASTYTWSAGATSTGVNTADASPITTTTYTVTGSSGTCSDTAHATVTVTTTPTVSVTNATICFGQTATLTASGATSYTWSPGATPTGVNTADVSPTTSSAFVVTGTTGSCSDTATSFVTVNPAPSVTVNSPSICEGQTANLVAGGATTYTWSAGATSTGTNTADASPITTTSYTVTGTTGTCTDTAVATVTVTPVPVVTVNSPTICEGQTATLTAGGATSYTWSAGATSSGTNTATAAPTTTTTYTVTGTTSGCSDTATSTVTVNPLPVVTVNSVTICDGQTATLTASGATTYTWSAGATSGGGSSATASPATTTSYTVTGTTNGCSDDAVATVTVDPCDEPVAAFSADDQLFCTSGCANFTDLSTNSPTSWSWSFPGGTPSSSTLQNPTNICYSVDGSYPVTLIATNASGSDTLTQPGFITVGVPASVTIAGNLAINACESTELSAFPADGTYEWGPNNNMQCNTCQTAVVAPSLTQQYYVTYTSPDGCTDSDTVIVVVTEIYTYSMPTGFS
ncbi:MAG: PKD domain-containing protein, partial [Bacteroidota bacterium]|nr:PKD domain-containing protein [Bacteroidota bacterium]